MAAKFGAIAIKRVGDGLHVPMECVHVLHIDEQNLSKDIAQIREKKHNSKINYNTFFGLLITPVLYPNCVHDPSTATVTVRSRAQVNSLRLPPESGAFWGEGFIT